MQNEEGKGGELEQGGAARHQKGSSLQSKPSTAAYTPGPLQSPNRP